MASFTKYHVFVEDLAEGKHDLGADTIKIALTNTAPTVASDAGLSDITEISAGSGYTTGGNAITITGSAQTSGTYALTQSADVTFTASGGTIGPFRYAVVYNDTSTGDRLIGYWDYGSSITLNDTETLTVDMGTNILTLT